MRLGRFVAVLAMASASCATRSAPAFTEAGAASKAASQTRAADVTRALRGDPPLPREAAGGWHGLEQPKDDPHAQHGHAPDHRAAPESSPGSSAPEHVGHPAPTTSPTASPHSGQH